MQPLTVNVKVIVITLFLVMIGTFTSPTFSQQFEEPDYSIRRGEVLGFEIDPETTSLIISIKARTNGELTITLPRDLIDAKIGSVDSDFIVIVDNLETIFFDETITSSDRTLIIPFGGFNSEITIVGTQVFSQVTTTPRYQQSVQKQQQDYLKYRLIPYFKD